MPRQDLEPLTTGPPNLLQDYTLANFLMALQMTGLASQISENFRQNAGTVTSPWAQIWPLVMGLCPPASNLSFRGPLEDQPWGPQGAGEAGNEVGQCTGYSVSIKLPIPDARSVILLLN